MSNWYKIALLDVNENPEGYYTDYGHDVYDTAGYYEQFLEPEEAEKIRHKQFMYPNYIWAYYNGDIIKMEEDINLKEHSEMDLPDMEHLYKGRYDPKTDIITLIKPIGSAQFRDIPSFLKKELHQAFPEAKEIYVF